MELPWGQEEEEIDLKLGQTIMRKCSSCESIAFSDSVDCAKCGVAGTGTLIPVITAAVK